MVDGGTMFNPVKGIELTDTVVAGCEHCESSMNELSLEQNFWRSMYV